MGEAKRRKLAGGRSAPVEAVAVTEAGRQFLDRMTPEVLQRVYGEASALCGNGQFTRILAGSDGKMFLYAPDDPESGSALDGLVRALDRRYHSPRKVPLWLVSMILEEPWELVMRGYSVSRREVVQLHGLFPWFPMTAERTWERCVEEAATIRAEQEAEALRARNAGRAVTPSRATI